MAVGGPVYKERFYPAVYNFQWSVYRQICPQRKVISHGGHKAAMTVLHHVLHHGRHWQTGTALGNLFKNTYLGSDCSQEQTSRSAEQSAWRPVGWFVPILFAPLLRTWREGEDTSENYLVASDDTRISQLVVLIGIFSSIFSISGRCF